MRPAGLNFHLKSPAHKAGMRISCPYCSRRFVTMTDAIAHAETTSQKCQIRESDLFREFIANISGGLIDVFMTKPDGIAFHVPRYVVPTNTLAKLVPGLRSKADEQPVTPSKHHSSGGSIFPVSAARVSSEEGSRADYW